jgi:hypothetical protein
LDTATAAAGMARPGMDTRQWISYGVVHAADPKKVVSFNTETKQPMVCVTLYPSQREVHCRVASTLAGNGEAEYHPFIEGDEVIVAIPEGDESAGCCIFGRLNNVYDEFPMESVAGQDPTTNTFGFRRRRTPFIEELSGPIMFRSVPSGAFLSIDTAGVVSLRDGDKNAFQMSPDVFGYVNNDGTAVLQMSLTGKQFIMQMGSAYMQLSDDANDPNTILTPGTLVIGTSGNTPAEHVMTVEAFVCAMKNFVTLYGTLLGFIPATTLDPMLATWVTASAAPGTGSLVDVPTTAAALAATFAMTIPKPPADPVMGLQLMPMLGCKGFLVG